ncbi:cytidylyltransferase domain-containing protein [Vibrio algivorus]|uniref:Acylneuraminate cytidylyltransferase family protein n=1 Tax=Vibrio algivorus TaxID=1667024 RepID=A0A557P4Y9_9VIBR|nr:acylneuraminate cytidylyltransferase family protein [Vibrio algivorus]TVO35735.1 acylneuraminate cytidylyltransferase family protein [Vibrio algivorus]
MIADKKLIAIIPARGGSQRLPRKNVLPLQGKPLIGWTIEAAWQSKYVDRVLVSTDDIEIATISKQFGAEVPELRPHRLASDSASTHDVIEHVLNSFCHDEYAFILLQPTSPLRCSIDIDFAWELFTQKQVDGVISVCPCEHSPLWSNHLSTDLSLDGFIRSDNNKRSQDLDEYHRLNGAIYTRDH